MLDLAAFWDAYKLGAARGHSNATTLILKVVRVPDFPGIQAEIQGISEKIRGIEWNSGGFCMALNQSPPRKPENWCRAKIVEKCRKIFFTLFEFFFALRKKMSKSVEKYFGHLLTFFDVAPFCGLLT